MEAEAPETRNGRMKFHWLNLMGMMQRFNMTALLLQLLCFDPECSLSRRFKLAFSTEEKVKTMAPTVQLLVDGR